MIHKLFRPKVLQEPGVDRHSQHVLDDEALGLVYVDTRQLIALRQHAESLPLSVAKVRALQSGQYYSPFKGRGMEFDELRLYQAGDDVRSMDWRVTARTGKPHTKLFREERERTVLLWVDFRNAMFFGTQGQFKSVLAAKVASLLAWSAAQQGDRLGGLVFDDEQHLELRPLRGKQAVLHMLNRFSEQTRKITQLSDYVDFSLDKNDSGLHPSMSRLRRVCKPGSLLFLISDFRNLDSQSEAHLYQLSRHNDVVLVLIYDALEMMLPPSGQYRVSDTINTMTIDTSSKKQRQEYEDRFQAHRDRLHGICKRNRMHFITIATSEDPLDALQREMGIRK